MSETKLGWLLGGWGPGFVDAGQPGCPASLMSCSPAAWFRHRSLIFLFSRPCGAALIGRFLSG